MSKAPRKTFPIALLYSFAALFTFANGIVGRAFLFDRPLLVAFFYSGMFLAPILFAFAIAALARRPTRAHFLVCLASLIGLPWFYFSESRIWFLGNTWIYFNIPDQELAWVPLWPVILRILAVAALVFSLVAAVFRLLPERWHLGKSQIRSWTWPAFALTLAVLAIWFLTATTPYRIPGAVDYSYYPDFQILHIEKRGLQFHEKCISLYGRRDGNSFSIFADDRRLFHYRFQTNHSSGQVPAALDERTQDWTQFAGTPNKELGTIRPLRSWNADGWYVAGRRFGFLSYTTENGRTPPPEITALFHDLEQSAPALQSGDPLKDVCLGFCFDQLAAMGYLYSNHRCFNDGKRETCR